MADRRRRDAPLFSRWLDDEKNITKRGALRAEFDAFFASPGGKMDAKEMVDRIVQIVPADEGRSATWCRRPSRTC